MLFVPLGIQGERRGVLSIQGHTADAFDDTDLKFLNLLAQHVSITLENAALREQLEKLTRIDRLTGLPNRRAFYSDVPLLMETARQEDQPLSLVMLDVRKFKHINDTFGHVVGDAVLVTLGTAFMQALPATGAVFRLSGDEFALLVWETEDRLDGLIKGLTESLRAATWPLGIGPVCLHGGAAQYVSGVSLAEWLSLADDRMYRAKRQGTLSHQTECCVDFGVKTRF